jgi:hypothetical protein
LKFLQFLFRAAFSLLIAFTISLSLAVTFFNYSGYKTIDRVFLILIPTLAIAYLLFEISPTLWKWLEKKLLLFRESHSIRHYFFGFLLSLLLTYAAVGFLNEAVKSTFSLVLITGGLTLAGSVLGYYLVRRAAQSFRAGFLNKPLNIILCLALPIFLSAFILASVQLPSMFIWGYITVPSGWLGWFIASALVAGIWGISVLEQFESRGYYQQFQQTIVFKFIKENMPGIYAGGMFFLINLIIARALNHPALSVNTVLFESDAGPWMSILGSPKGDVINRAVHPLVLITVRPLVRFVAMFMPDQWNLATMLVVAALSGLCVLMAWIFVKRATQEETYAFIFAVMLGSTAPHLFFGSLTDTYIFGVTSLIFFFLLIQAKENRFSVLVPAGLLLFGITVTNFAQGVIGLFFNKFGFWRLVKYCVVVIATAVALTVLTSALYPNAQTFFFVPGDIAFEGHFVKPVYDSPAERLIERFKIVSRTMLLYGVTAPRPLEIIAHKPPRPTIDLKTFEPSTHALASYKGLANIPLALWLILLAGSFLFFIKGLRSSPHLPLMLGLLGNLAFNFILHMNYGTELFLYTPFWTYALIFFIALAFADLADKNWFQAILTFFVVVLMINNFWFIFVILRGLAPFYAAA